MGVKGNPDLPVGFVPQQGTLHCMCDRSSGVRPQSVCPPAVHELIAASDLRLPANFLG